MSQGPNKEHSLSTELPNAIGTFRESLLIDRIFSFILIMLPLKFDIFLRSR